jgi:hypothetical protein
MLLPRSRPRSTWQALVEAYTALSVELNIPLFDASSYIEQVASLAQLPSNDLFSDDGHLKAHIAYAMGQDLAGTLLELGGRPWPSARESWCAHVYFALSASELFLNAPVQRRSTSLLKHKFAALRPESTFQVKLPENVEAVGIYVNLAKSTGIMRLSGQEEVTLDFGNVYAAGLDELVLSVQAFPNPIVPSRNHLDFTIISRLGAPHAGVRRVLPHGWQSNEVASVEVGGLVLRRRRQRPAETRPAPSGEDALLRVTPTYGVKAARLSSK